MNFKIIWAMLLVPYVTVNSSELSASLLSLTKLLNFLELFPDKLNFDGLFALTLTTAQLKLIGPEALPLVRQCERVYQKAWPFLPQSPAYMIQFRSLLNYTQWEELGHTKPFPNNKVLGMGSAHYNWTRSFLSNQHSAQFKSHPTDQCLRELITSNPNQRLVSPLCYDMMWAFRQDHAYLLTHRLLYFQVFCYLERCALSDWYNKYTTWLCADIMREAHTNAQLEYANFDLFLEQIALCSMEGFDQLLQTKWLNVIVKRQNGVGCYGNPKPSKNKRTSKQIVFGCSDHTTGLAGLVLSLYVRRLAQNTTK